MTDTTQIQSYMTDLGTKARKASAVLAAVEAKVKNDALYAIADELVTQIWWQEKRKVWILPCLIA